MFGWVKRAKAECAQQKAKALAKAEAERLRAEVDRRLDKMRQMGPVTASVHTEASWRRAREAADQAAGLARVKKDEGESE